VIDGDHESDGEEGQAQDEQSRTLDVVARFTSRTHRRPRHDNVFPQRNADTTTTMTPTTTRPKGGSSE